ncbi:MAG: triphosphoribosyl-dephospho-CoA synthase [Promethearchaeota archaeon]
MKESYFISIDSLQDILRCANLASLLEVSGHPKPGNVHRTQDFKGTRFEHFLAGTAAILPNLWDLIQRTYESQNPGQTNYSQINLGAFFKNAASEMVKWQKGGNVMLGHILILGPLVATCAACLKNNTKSFIDFSNTLYSIIDNATVEDTLLLYEAITTCNPGGLGSVDQYDLNHKNSIKEIQKKKIKLLDIFNLSKERDLISKEYSTGFNVILIEGFPYYMEEFKKTKDINIATVNTYLKLLSEHEDSLVIRKSGLVEAKKLSKRALEIVKKGGLSSSIGSELTVEFDSELHEKNGKLNPGTTADLIAGIIFCALIFGLKF